VGSRFVIVGAGTAFLPGIALAIAGRAEAFAGTTVVLHDVDPAALEPMAALAGRIIAERGSTSIAVEATTDLARAIDGADIALATFRPGGYAGRISDERIPLAFGLAGCEAAGMGGFAMALRSVPAVVRLADELARSGDRDAVLLDYVNPVGIVTDAVRRAVPAVRVIGLCDQYLGEARFLASLLCVEPGRVTVDAAGVNHCTWTRTVRLDRVDITAEVMDLLSRRDPASVDPYWAFVVRRAPRLGMIPSAYLRYYLEPSEVLAEQRAAGRTRGEVVAAEFPSLMAGYREALNAPDPVPPVVRGDDGHGDLAVSVVAAIRSGSPATVTLDVGNAGPALPGLAEDATVEVPCRLEGREVAPAAVEPLPADAMAILEPVVRHNRLAADGALENDRTTLLEAMLAHPLGPSKATAGSMLDVILAANTSIQQAAA
jgi:6-phospho-beta-glucosidase